MSEYRRQSDGVLFDDTTIRAAFPNTSFPPTLTTAMLNSIGFDPVTYADPPTHTSNQIIARNGVVQDTHGNWIFAWSITSLPASIDVSNPDAEQAAVAMKAPGLLWLTGS